MRKLSKSEANREIEEFFSDVKSKTPEQVKKIKRLAANSNIRLKEKRKSFCRRCLVPYTEKEKIRIHKGIKSIGCGNCGYVSRYKISSIKKSD